MVSHCRFKLWLNAIRQQAIIWTKVDQGLQCYIASHGLSELEYQDCIGWALLKVSVCDCGRSITVMSHECHGTSNCQPLDCWYNNLFVLTTKKISKPCTIDPLGGITWWPVHFPPTKVNLAENAFMSWCHHVYANNNQNYRNHITMVNKTLWLLKLVTFMLFEHCALMDFGLGMFSCCRKAFSIYLHNASG